MVEGLHHSVENRSETDDVLLDDYLASCRKYVGKEIKEVYSGYSRIDPEVVKHYAYGIGDDNPLWWDEEYARSSPCHDTLAPPTFLAVVEYPVLHGPPSDPRIGNLYAGTDWKWYRPLRKGDRISCKKVLADVQEKMGKRAGRMLFLETEATYRNQEGVIVGVARSKLIRHIVGSAQTLVDRSIHKYSQEEIAKILDDIDREVRRGATPRYWEDTRIGELVTPVVKGPLSIEDLIAGPSAGHGGACEIWARKAREPLSESNPLPPLINPITGWYAHNGYAHTDFYLSKFRGMPGPFDGGVRRIAWIGHMLTNWMGDHGFLRSLSVRVSMPNFYGDTSWISGSVKAKSRDGDDFIAQIEIKVANQRGEITASGEADVALPSRENRTIPVELR